MSAEHNIVLPLELALVRWSVVCQSWQSMSAGHSPLLTAFLAGWGCRCIGIEIPSQYHEFRDSFRAGWREADTEISIQRAALDNKEAR